MVIVRNYYKLHYVFLNITHEKIFVSLNKRNCQIVIIKSNKLFPFTTQVYCFQVKFKLKTLILCIYISFGYF